MDATTRLAAGSNCLLGCWLIAVPFAFAASEITRWNGVVVGTAVALVAGYNYVSVRTRRPASAAGAGLVAILGSWLVVAPFVLGLDLEGPVAWSDVVAGTVIAGFGSYNAYVVAAVARDSPVYETAADRNDELETSRDRHNARRSTDGARPGKEQTVRGRD